MCKHAYEQISERTKKRMIFCKLMGNDGNMSQLCVGQRFCNEKDKYVECNQKKNCKNYE